MQRVAGLGGIFLKARDPKALAAWYQEHLGIPFNGNSYTDMPFTDPEGKLSRGYNVLSFFKEDSTYFAPSEKQVMINLRVSDLFGLLEQLKMEKIELVGEPVDE